MMQQEQTPYTVLARWQTKWKRDWVEVREYPEGFTIKTKQSNEVLHGRQIATKESMISYVEGIAAEFHAKYPDNDPYKRVI